MPSSMLLVFKPKHHIFGLEKEGKLGTMVQWVRMLGYLVLKSGIEPSLPPAATNINILMSF
ncbi:conserved hypothetical protein [Ricinus communis]|uniref:Uncharacterized protein n=1 Tax=Ricinus communis TaxID=3988 RepID=B9SRE0_RICCO|nr:conserved hypothetical protein [Ricinus communis]